MGASVSGVAGLGGNWAGVEGSSLPSKKATTLLCVLSRLEKPASFTGEKVGEHSELISFHSRLLHCTLLGRGEGIG